MWSQLLWPRVCAKSWFYTAAYVVDTRLTGVSFLTNKDSTSVAPNTNENGGWNTCYHSSRDPGVQFNIRCNTNSQTPITREFAIAASTTAIELKEVEIYRHGKYVFNKVILFKALH